MYYGLHHSWMDLLLKIVHRVEWFEARANLIQSDSYYDFFERNHCPTFKSNLMTSIEGPSSHFNGNKFGKIYLSFEIVHYSSLAPRKINRWARGRQ